MRVLRFIVENHRSFREAQELSFLATARTDEAGDVIDGSVHAEHGVLPVVGVYGANASGKSNLLEALLMMRSHVLQSFTARPDAEVPSFPWMGAFTASRPVTRCVLDFTLMDEASGALVRHQYGFAHDRHAFVEEWLYRWPTHRRQVLFERYADEEEPWYFGPSFHGPKATLAEQTRPNALFVSVGAHHNHPLLTSIYRAFSSGIRPESEIELRGFPLFHEQAAILAEERRDAVLEVLRAFDLGCTGFRIQPLEMRPPQGLFDMLRPEVAERVQASMAENADQKLHQIVLERTAADWSIWTLPPEHESRGTQILLQRINDLLTVQHGLLVIDELETSLHPDICRAIIELFSAGPRNPSGRQLLFATHNRELMDHLRRDAVVLVEKDLEGVSHLSSAADFRGIRKRDQLSRLHARGRMGGVPVLGSLDGLAGA